MLINNTSRIEDIKQATQGEWSISNLQLGQDEWTVISFGQIKIYEATLKAGLHIIPFTDLTRTRIIELFTNNTDITKHKILKMKQSNFTIDENAICRIIFY